MKHHCVEWRGPCCGTKLVFKLPFTALMAGLMLCLGGCHSKLTEHDLFNLARNADPKAEYILQGITGGGSAGSEKKDQEKDSESDDKSSDEANAKASKDENPANQDSEILTKGLEEDAEDKNLILTCAVYGEGCISVRLMKVFELGLIAVEYESPQQAKTMALKIDGHIKDNWLFDDVSGEPVLEHFVRDAYGATRPLEPYLKNNQVQVKY